MKKLTLLFLALALVATTLAQLRPAPVSKAVAGITVTEKMIDDAATPLQAGNAVVNTKAVLDDLIGGSRYDNQSNASCANRVYLYPDGTLSATWTRGLSDPSYTDRGTGYNYFDGTSWGPQPTSRLETIRAGWPNVAPWNGGGEIIISHQSATKPMIMMTRPVKGTGAWTESLIQPPTGAAGLDWPRMITSGPDHNYIHVLVCSGPTSLGGTVYQGLDAAILYYRSLDGGATWDKAGVILPQMTSADYNGFGGDDYAWATPHGDTLVFVVGGTWSDVFMMKSVDNGTTWTKTQIMPHYYTKNPPNQITPRFVCSDGSLACEMDKTGRVHVAFGRMRALDDGTGHKYAPGTDGLVYWNSDMPVLDTLIVTDIDSLIAHNLCIGYVAANQAGDTIVDFPYYQVSLSSHPQLLIDDFNNIFFLWSSVTVGNPSPDPYNYRHVWARAWFNNKPQWEEMIDLNSDVLYMFQEYVWPTAAKRIMNDKLRFITQTSPQPGSNLIDETVPVHDVYTEYREVPISVFVPASSKQTPAARNHTVGQNFPNPVKDITRFTMYVAVRSAVNIAVYDVMGKQIMNLDKGMVSEGSHSFTLDATGLAPGLYFLKVNIGGESFTRRMIVE
jgi:hypothetical protein